jgi:hypothetical protein
MYKLKDINMKKILLFSISFFLILSYSANAQFGKLVNKVANSVTKEIKGKSANNKAPEPEPACACDDSELILDLGGKLQIDYAELSITVSDEGNILARDIHSDDYYVVKNGIAEGPYKTGDTRLSEFSTPDGNNEKDYFLKKYKSYITPAGEKYVINFGGKTYGPYALINNFVVTKSKDKFAAVVTENVIMTEEQSNKMNEAMKNAKTDQERMDLSMKYGQEMQQRMLQGGNPASIVPKLITNIPNATFDPSTKGGNLNNSFKYDDILVYDYQYVKDLQGKNIVTFDQANYGTTNLLINSTNTRYAIYNDGVLTFSDKTKLTQLFAPHLVQADGKIWLAYMYYSPKKNAIMQCKIPF